MSITFLHAADLHLDSPLRGLERYENAPVDRIRNATRRALTRMIDLAIEKRVDFVLIAGDLYDGDWRDYATVIQLRKELRRLEVPVILIAGNHDAVNKMTRELRLPENVTMLASDRPETVMLDQFDVAVHGQSFARQAVLENLAASYPPPVRGRVNIGLLHTGLGGREGHEPYAPCTIDDLRLRGYDYWALGHIHRREVVCQGPAIVFPGNVQGRHIRETGPKGCVIATINSDHGADTVFERLDQARWERERLDLNAVDHEDDLAARISELFQKSLADEPDQDRLLALRVVLSGATGLHDQLRARHEEFTALARALASDVGGDRLWVEKLDVQTRPTRAPHVPEGPIEEILEVLEEMRADPASIALAVDDLGGLKRKLPPELASALDDACLDGAEGPARLLEQTRPLLLDLLRRPADGADHDRP